MYVYIYTFFDLFSIIGPKECISLKWEFLINKLLSSPFILINDPLVITVLAFKCSITKFLCSSPESNNMNEESPLSPVQETFSISMLSKLIL